MKTKRILWLAVCIGIVTMCYPLARHKRGQEIATPGTQATTNPAIAEQDSTLDIAPAPEILAQSDSAADAHDEDVDLKKKQAETEKLVQAGISYLEAHQAEEAFNMFSNDKQFIRGELYLFVIDAHGNCLAHGDDHALIWQNLYNFKDEYGAFFIQDIIKKAATGGGWISYQWRGASKETYVKQINKDGTTYILGAGYYPQSKEDAVIGLVRGAVEFFNQTVAEGRPAADAFSVFSYPLGRFVLGDLYLYALDFSGVHHSHGELPEIIGTSGWEYRDARGKLVNQEIISKLKTTDGGIWVDYVSKNAAKRTYAQKVKDATGKEYFIACGFYPSAGREQVINLVREGYQFMKLNGKSQAARRFTDKRELEFRYGDLYLFVYDMKGICIAHGGNPGLVGSNQWDAKDEDGRYFVREMVEKAQAGGGFMAYKLKNSFEITYVEKIDLGVEDYVIGSGLYPVSKFETMLMLTKSAASFMRTNSNMQALGEFVKPKGKFIRGDLTVFVFNANGICLAYGDDSDVIWRNMFNYKDDTGALYVQNILKTAQGGYGKVQYTLNGVRKTAFVEKVEKDGAMYAVGSSYYN